MNDYVGPIVRIGSIVYYTRYGSPGGEHKAEPSPAVVTQLFDGNVCQLFVMNPNGVYFNKTPFSPTPKPGHWTGIEDYYLDDPKPFNPLDHEQSK